MASETQHTPGPWQWAILDLPLKKVGRYVDECIAASGGDKFYFVATDGADVAHVGNGPRGFHNARLIAAAPAMLEALQAYHAAYLDDGSQAYADLMNHADELMLAAIARATSPPPRLTPLTDWKD